MHPCTRIKNSAQRWFLFFYFLRSSLFVTQTGFQFFGAPAPCQERERCCRAYLASRHTHLWTASTVWSVRKHVSRGPPLLTLGLPLLLQSKCMMCAIHRCHGAYYLSIADITLKQDRSDNRLTQCQTFPLIKIYCSPSEIVHVCA